MMKKTRINEATVLLPSKELVSEGEEDKFACHYRSWGWRESTKTRETDTAGAGEGIDPEVGRMRIQQFPKGEHKCLVWDQGQLKTPNIMTICSNDVPLMCIIFAAHVSYFCSSCVLFKELQEVGEEWHVFSG